MAGTIIIVLTMFRQYRTIIIDNKNAKLFFVHGATSSEEVLITIVSVTF